MYSKKVIEYAAVHLLHISTVHARQGTRKVFVFNFSYSVWLDTFSHIICCIYVQLNRQCCRAHDIVKIQIIRYMPEATYMPPEKEAVLGLPQLGVRLIWMESRIAVW